MQRRLNEAVPALFRIVVGLLFLLHGSASMFGVFGGNRGSGESIPLGQWPGWYASLIQVVCGALVIAGLGTRIAAVICSGSMAYAYFVVHQPNALFPHVNGGETAALFCWSFLLIAVLGPGRWSLDALMGGRKAGSSKLEPATAES
ncbi:DoxX family protein [Flindersiella endophytica]